MPHSCPLSSEVLSSSPKSEGMRAVKGSASVGNGRGTSLTRPAQGSYARNERLFLRSRARSLLRGGRLAIFVVVIVIVVIVVVIIIVQIVVQIVVIQIIEVVIVVEVVIEVIVEVVVEIVV